MKKAIPIFTSLLLLILCSSGVKPKYALCLNAKNDTLFESLEDFMVNEYLIIADSATNKNYRFKSAEIWFHYTSKNMRHMQNKNMTYNLIPKQSFNICYSMSTSTINVFIQDIKLEHRTTKMLVNGQDLAFKIKKKM